ncbi:MAG: nitroreductase family protein [Candidatus Thorarchaeota archaeon]|jgi:nitroreductase
MSEQTGYELKKSEEFFDVVEQRRSIRKYKEYDIPTEDLTKILEAARLAPSTNNSQPWRFVVVKDRDTINLLTLVAGNQKFIANANDIIMALADRGASCCPGNPSQWHVQDTMIAAEHVVLAATALGYGSCWVAMLDSRHGEDIEVVKNALRIPEDVDIVSLVTLGIPDETPAPRQTKSLQGIAFTETYGNSWLSVDD